MDSRRQLFELKGAGKPELVARVDLSVNTPGQ